jgi:hypothetical protein
MGSNSLGFGGTFDFFDLHFACFFWQFRFKTESKLVTLAFFTLRMRGHTKNQQLPRSADNRRQPI